MRRNEKRFSLVAHISTQTDESSLGNGVHEDSLWLTDPRHQAAVSTCSQISVGQNESCASYPIGAGVGDGASSLIDQLSIKSTSAVPPARYSKKGNGSGISLGRTRMHAVATASVSSGTSKNSKSVPLDMRNFNEKNSARAPRASDTSSFPGITGHKKPITVSNSPEAPLKATTDRGIEFEVISGHSPQSSTSISPRPLGGNEDGSTIFSASPRFNDEDEDDDVM